MKILHHVPVQKLGLIALLLVALMVVGCTEIGNMQEQAKYQKPFDASENFDSTAYVQDPNAVPQGFLQEDTHLYEGMVDGELADTIPIDITEDVILEGKRQYDGFCSPCHGYSGYADGVVVQEGLPAPPSFHTEEARANPVGFYYGMITNGGGLMFSYASRLDPEERWAVVAYIRTMQLSQYADVAAFSDDLQAKFREAVNANETAMRDQ